MEQTPEKWYLEPMIEIAAELNSKSDWTWEHSGRVARYAVAFGRKLGLDHGQMTALQCAALLHDVGKSIVPDSLLNKVSKLSLDEWYSITKHPMASAQIIKGSSIPVQIASIARSHHEWFDGTGYPMGLKGDAIPLGARILSLADACDAMSSDRPYRPALKPKQMIDQLEKGAGTQFDPVLLARLRPLIQSDLSTLLAAKKLRVIASAEILLRQLWFALYPLGWDLELFSPEMLAASSAEVAQGRSGNSALQLTIVDGRSVREDMLDAETAHGPVIWIDAPAGTVSDLQRPLDLESLLARVQEDEPLPENENIRVLLADPYHLFRQGLKHCLEGQPGIEVVAEVDSGIDFRKLRTALRHDIAIVASDMVTGTLTTGTLRQGDIPLEESETLYSGRERPPVIMLVSDEDLEDPRLADRIWQPGTTVTTGAFIYRGSPAEVLVEAVRTVVVQVAGSRQA